MRGNQPLFFLYQLNLFCISIIIVFLQFYVYKKEEKEKVYRINLLLDMGEVNK